MRKASVELRFGDYFRQINSYTNLLIKVTEAKSLMLTNAEKKKIFEAFLLKIYGVWELFVGELLVDCLSRDTSQYARDRGVDLPKHLSRNVCGCLVAGFGFFDFRDISDLKGKAKRILVRDNNPFQAIPREHGNKIDEFRIMRNYIAHRSDTAKRRLKGMYGNVYGMKRFREPGDFLLARITRGPLSGELRFAGFIDSLFRTGDKMAEFLGVN